MTYHSLGLVEVGLAALLLVVNAALSWGFRLGLERTLAVAALRMVVQLAAVGFVLKFVFEQSSAWITAAAAIVMLAVASWESLRRAGLRIGGGWQHWGIGASAMTFAGTIGAVYAASLIVPSEPWWTPRTLLPILGMVLGNLLTGVSLVLDTLATNVKRERPAIEGLLALGATRLEAIRPALAAALRTGMMPMINSMAAAGVVSLPGMMSGQILAGADPVEAAKYQIMILCVIAGTSALGMLIAGGAGVWLMTDSRHRLRIERLVPGA